MNYKIFVVLVFRTATFGCVKTNIIIQNFEADQIVHCSEIKKNQ